MATAPQRFSEFLAFLEAILTEEMRSILPLVMKRYNSCSRPFKNSTVMLNLLTDTKRDMERDRRHMFIYLKDFLTELSASQERERKANELKRKRDSGSSDSDNSSDESEAFVCKKSKTSHESIVKECVNNVPATKSTSNALTNSKVFHNGCLTIKKEFPQSNLPQEQTKHQPSKPSYRVENDVCICLSSSEEDEQMFRSGNVNSSVKANVKADPMVCSNSKDLPNGEMSSASKSSVPQHTLNNSESTPVKNTVSSLPSTPTTPKQDPVVTLDRVDRILPDKETLLKALSLNHSGPSNNLDHVHVKDKSPIPSVSAEVHNKDYKKKKEVSEKHIHKLEKLLAKLRNEIEKSREKELSLDDLDAEDSSYIYEDRLEKKFVAAWRKLCDIKKRTPKTGLPTERRFTYSGTRYSEINTKIERLVNKKKIFPDYFDIRNIFHRVNKEKCLNLSAKVIASLSKETFADVGNILQQRRHEDFVTTFGSKQTEGFRIDRDPALFDKELKRKLDENRQMGKTNLAKVISKYADMENNIVDTEDKVTSDTESPDEVEESALKELSGDEDYGKKTERLTARCSPSDTATSKHLTREQVDPHSSESDTEIHVDEVRGEKERLTESHNPSNTVTPKHLTHKQTKPHSSESDTEIHIDKDFCEKERLTESPNPSNTVTSKHLTHEQTNPRSCELDTEIHVEKSHSYSAIQASTPCLKSSHSDEIQPRSTDKNIWPSPIKVIPVKTTFDRKLNEPSMSCENVMGLHSVDENKLAVLTNTTEISVIEINDSQNLEDDKTQINEISADDEMVILDANDSDIQLEPSISTEAQTDISAVNKNTELIVDVHDESSHTVEDKTLTKKISAENTLFQDIKDDGDTELKSNTGIEISKGVSVHENKVDVISENNESIAEGKSFTTQISTNRVILVLDDDGGDDSTIQLQPSMSTEGPIDISVNKNKELIANIHEESSHIVEDKILTNKMSAENKALFQDIKDNGDTELKSSTGIQNSMGVSENIEDLTSQNKESIAEEKSFTTQISTNGVILVLDDDCDENGDVHLKSTIHTQTLKDLSDNKINSFKSRELTENSKTSNYKTHISNTSTDSEIVVLDDDGNDEYNHHDIHVKPSLSMETSKGISINENQVDVNPVNKKPIPENIILTKKISTDDEVLVLDGDDDIQLKSSNDDFRLKPSNDDDSHLKPRNDDDSQLNPSSDDIQLKPNNDDFQLKPSNDDDSQLKPRNDDDSQLNPSSDDIQLKPSNDDFLLKLSNDDDSQLKPSNDDFQLKPSNDDDIQLKPSSDDIQLKPSIDDDIQLNTNDDDNIQLKPRNDDNTQLKPSINDDVKLHPSNDDIKLKPRNDDDIQLQPRNDIQLKPRNDYDIQLKQSNDHGCGDVRLKTSENVDISNTSVNEKPDGTDLEKKDISAITNSDKNNDNNQCDRNPAAHISGNSDVEDDLNMLKKETTHCDQSVSHVPSNDSKDVSSLETVSEMEKRKIHLQIPEHLLKKTNYEGEDKIVKVESQIKLSGIKYAVAISGLERPLKNSDVLSKLNSSDSGEVNKVSSSNIPADDDENDVILLSSYFEESDDDVIVLSD